MTQGSLFDMGPEPGDLPEIPGLKYVPDYITTDQQRRLLKHIDMQEWITELKRRVQHYGYKYGYKSPHKLTPIGKLPQWASYLAKKLHEDGLTPTISDQVIVNEYQPGQGISPHVDLEDCFDDTIVSISMLSPCVMEFIHTETREKVETLLMPRSAIVLSGEARHDWKHAIPQRKTDIYQGQKIERERRVSMTFRKALENNSK
jgi:alkylated DNA repair dioxygenase AlkB